jgi:hypothetical protein
MLMAKPAWRTINVTAEAMPTRDAMGLAKQIMREHPLSRATAELTALQ